MARRNVTLETIAHFRVGVVSRPEFVVDFPIQEPIFVLDNALLQTWNMAPDEPVQLLVVRNPDAWRLKILLGPPAEKDGIASLEWLMDSQLSLHWAGFQISLEVKEPDQSGERHENRSGLFQMAANLAAGNLQLEQERQQFEIEQSHHTRQRFTLGEAFQEKLSHLKNQSKRLKSRQKTISLAGDQVREARAQARKKENQIRLREEVLEKAIDRMVALRARAVTRWRTHVEQVLQKLEIKHQEIDLLEKKNLEIQGQLTPLLEKLQKDQALVIEADRKLNDERNEMRGALDSWRRDEVARQGQWLQRHAELTQKENQIRVEAALLQKLRTSVENTLSSQPALASVSWESILKEALKREWDDSDRQVALDSWTKRLELWAGTLGEREILCAKREQELASIATEYHTLRLRREEELSNQAFELNQREIALQEERSKTRGQNPTRATQQIPEQILENYESSRIGNLPEIDLSLGPKAVDLANREADLTQKEAELVRLGTQYDAKARKLAEEAIVLEKYRIRLMAETPDSQAGKKEVKLLLEQLKKRTAAQRQSLASQQDYLLRLGRRLKKWAKSLAMREANIVETELRMLEERTQISVGHQVIGFNTPAGFQQKAA